MQYMLNDRNGKGAGYDIMRPRLLLVDDQWDLLMTNGIALQTRLPDHDIVMAPGPERALAEIRRNPHGWAAIVTDYLMPGMTGVDLLVASTIYSFGDHHHQNLPRVLISSKREHWHPELRQSIDLEHIAREMGIQFMVRPSGPMAFATAVANYLHEHQRRYRTVGSEIIDGHLVPRDISELQL